MQDSKYQKKDSIVPIKCTWFFTSPENPSLSEIRGQQSCFYQTSLQDVGRTIYVEAYPQLGVDEYSMAPLFSQRGPIEVEPEYTLQLE